jgi:hypothetical protein
LPVPKPSLGAAQGKMKKIISITLSSLMLLQTAVMPGLFGAVVIAQEVIPTETTTTSVESTPAPAIEVQSSPAPQTNVAATPTPVPTPTPMSKAEYDAWKIEKNKLDEEEDARDDEWEAHEEDKAWVEAHGGSTENYVSGQWQREQDAKAAEEAAKSQPTTDPTTQAALENDPFAGTQESPQSTQTTQNQCTSSPEPDFGTTVEADAFGDDTTATATANNNDSANVNNNNCAVVGNNSYAGGTTGSNNMSQNDGSVDMTTGNAGANGQLQNNGNINTTDADYLGSASSSTNDSFAEGGVAENLNTGEDSENFSQSNESFSLTVQNDNAAYVDNQMDVEGVSGDNTLTENDGDVELTTGDIELIANMLNILNLNITGDDFMHLIVNIFGKLDGNLDLDDIALALGYQDDDQLELIAQNDTTGEDSTNTAEVNHETNTDITNNNTAVVNNEMNVSGVSGRNEVSGNDGGADVLTGRIKILANMMNFINSNFSGEKWSFIMVNIFGSLNGNIVLPGTENYLNADGSAVASNTSLGEGSTNNQTANSLDQTDVTNANNITLNNTINANGVSGNNQQNGNDDGDGEHTATSGGTDVTSQLMNFLNFNITGNNWVFLVVNVFGKWMGQIVGFGDNGPLAAPTDGSFAALSVGSGGTTTTAMNSSTGEDSINNATTNSLNQTSVNNNNGAIVNNTMNIEGVSGENAVNNNDAGTKITTGWVEIDANLLNIINMNVTGRSWMIVFLNVFGDFTGNMFFGRDNYNSYTAAAAPEAPRGGSSENSNSNSTTNSNANAIQTTSNGQVSVIPAIGSKSNAKVAVFGVEDTGEVTEEEIVVNGVTYELPEETEEQTPTGILGFIITQFNQLKSFFLGVYASVRTAVEPIFARIQDNQLLSFTSAQS